MIIRPVLLYLFFSPALPSGIISAMRFVVEINIPTVIYGKYSYSHCFASSCSADRNYLCKHSFIGRQKLCFYIMSQTSKIMFFMLDGHNYFCEHILPTFKIYALIFCLKLSNVSFPCSFGPYYVYKHIVCLTF